jgi:hypothetical protein
VGTEGVHSTAAHAKQGHPLTRAHSPTYAVHGQTVYVVCGFGGCPHRLAVDAAVWEAEAGRRRAACAAEAALADAQAGAGDGADWST